MPMSISLYGVPHAMKGVTDCEVAGPLEGVDAGMEPTRTQRRAAAIRRWVWTCAITAKIYWVMICLLPPRRRGVKTWCLGCGAAWTMPAAGGALIVVVTRPDLNAESEDFGAALVP